MQRQLIGSILRQIKLLTVKLVNCRTLQSWIIYWYDIELCRPKYHWFSTFLTISLNDNEKRTSPSVRMWTLLANFLVWCCRNFRDLQKMGKPLTVPLTLSKLQSTGVFVRAFSHFYGIAKLFSIAEASTKSERSSRPEIIKGSGMWVTIGLSTGQSKESH